MLAGGGGGITIKIKKYIVLILILILSGCGLKGENDNQISEMKVMFDSPETTEKQTNEEQAPYFEQQQELAENGDIEAMNYIAYAYYYGIDTEQSYENSFKWSLEAAESGDAASQYNTGWLYEKGEGVEQSDANALNWYCDSAMQNFPKALTALGYMYHKGIAVEVDNNKALDFFYKAAGGLDSDAMLCIAQMYEQGQGYDKNREKAYFWYDLAASNASEKKYIYDILQQQYDKDKNVTKTKKMPLTEKNIPEQLISEIQKYFVTYDIGGFLDKYSTASFHDFHLLELSDKMKEFIEKQDTQCYKADFDGDDKDELIFYILEGSSGACEIFIFSQNESGIYDYEGDVLDYGKYVSYGVNGLIEFENRYFYLIAYQDLRDRTIYGVELFSFTDKELSGSVYITREQEGFDLIKTFQEDKTLAAMVEELESEINMIMDATSPHADTYFGEERRLEETKEVNGTADLNNDGVEEYFCKNMWLSSSINSVNQLNLIFFKKEQNGFKEDSSVDFLNSTYFSGILQQFFVKEYQGVNYLVTLMQKEGTHNYSLTVYKWSEEQAALVSNFLIYIRWKPVEIDVISY